MSRNTRLRSSDPVGLCNWRMVRSEGTRRWELSEDLERIALQERELALPRLDAQMAWELGSRLRTMAAERGLAVVIDVRRFGQPLFYAAMEGTTPDNAEWVRRKSNVVARFHRSSYAVRADEKQKNQTLFESQGLPVADYATHGGSFPLSVAGAGVVGSVTVSGLPSAPIMNWLSKRSARCWAAYARAKFGERVGCLEHLTMFGKSEAFSHTFAARNKKPIGAERAWQQPQTAFRRDAVAQLLRAPRGQNLLGTQFINACCNRNLTHMSVFLSDRCDDHFLIFFRSPASRWSKPRRRRNERRGGPHGESPSAAPRDAPGPR